MKTTHITIEEYEEIAARMESHFFDLKSKMIDGRGIQKIAVAFANADGGEFIVGILDKNDAESVAKRWDGFIEIEAMNGCLQAVFEVKPSISVQYDFLTCDIAPGYLLRVSVEKSSEVLSTLDGRIVLRHGAQSITVKDAGKIQELAFSKGATSFEDSVLSGLPTELITESD